MNIRFSIIILAAVLFFGSFSKPGAQLLDFPAAASDVSVIRPATTAPKQVAMLFHLLAKKTPDYAAWARSTQEYKDALPVERMLVEKQQSEKMKGEFSLLTAEDRIIVEMPVKISSYSKISLGFLIDSFKEDTFFPIRFAEDHYALIPYEIMDRQFISASDPQIAEGIEAAAAAAPERMLSLVLYLKLRSADGSSPALIEDTAFWLMSADVEKMELYTPAGDRALWYSDGEDKESEARQQELMNLYK